MLLATAVPVLLALGGFAQASSALGQQAALRELCESIPPARRHIDCHVNACDWTQNVVCDSSGRASSIRFESMGLTGTIPRGLFNLTSLTHLRLFNNSISGTVPIEAGQLTALVFLKLAANKFSGTLPSALGSSTSLAQVWLFSNSLSGTISSALGNSTMLTQLFLYNNSLSGTIPSVLGKSTALTNLDLFDHVLSGTIPSALGKLTALTTLLLFNNALSGSLPYALGGSTALTILDLSSTSLSGTIPSVLGNLTALTRLELYSNSLSGTIPSALGIPTALTYLGLYDISVSGTIPPALGNPQGLTHLVLGRNFALSGTIPPALSSPTALRFLQLSYNSLSGTLPRTLGTLSAMRSLDLRSNSLDLPSSADERANFDEATRICAPRGRAACLGIAPQSCTAFGLNAELNVLDPYTCIACNDASPVGILSAAVLAIVTAFAAFTRYALRHPQAAMRSISTLALLITHAQTVAVTASLALKWPPLFTQLLALVSLNPLNLPAVSCLLKTNNDETMKASTESFGVLALSMMISGLALLLLPLVVSAVARVRRLRDLEDSSELILSMVFSLQLLLSWNAFRGVLVSVFRWQASEGVQVILYSGTFDADNTLNPGTQTTGSFGELSSQERAAMVLAPLLLALQLALAARFLGRIRSFKRGVDSGEWRLGGGGACAGCSPCPGGCRSSGKLQASAQQPGAAPSRTWRLVHRAAALLHQWCCASEPIAPRRLAKRVRFLSGRFAPHALRWQLIIWARQLALFVIVVTLDVLNEVTNLTERDPWWPVIFGVITVAILLIAWCYHARTQPYAYWSARHSLRKRALIGD